MNEILMTSEPLAQSWSGFGTVVKGPVLKIVPFHVALCTMRQTAWALNALGNPEQYSFDVTLAFQGATLARETSRILHPGQVLWIKGSVGNLSRYAEGESGLCIHVGGFKVVGEVRRG